MAGTSSDAENARKTWEIENEIETLPASDEIFRYDAQEQQQFLAARKLIGEFVCCCNSVYLTNNFVLQDHGKKIRTISKIFKSQHWHC